jgi:transcriptional regulator with XRE-family HTH domain
MKLGEKIRYLREVEGSLRGLDRAMTQQELVRAIREERGAAMSQSYLSQIESGARPHLTNTTRLLLARFFKVHPGYLVDDPEGYHAELLSEARMLHTRIHEDKLDLWLISGAEKFRRDPELRRALLTAAQHEDTRRCLLLLAAILETPSLADRLLEVLRPELAPRRKSLALVNGAEPIRQTGPNADPDAGVVPDKTAAVRAAPQRNGGATVATNGRRPRTAIGKKERR